MSAAISPTCASAIRTTFRQNRAFRGMSVQHNEQLCLAEGTKVAAATGNSRENSGNSCLTLILLLWRCRPW
jgi:hypothetical protein